MRVPNWYRVDDEQIRFYRAWNLHSSGMVNHGFSTRVGGVSAALYESLNLSFTVGDDASNVIANRKAFAASLGVDVNRIVAPSQVHSTSVKLVTEADAGRGALDQASAIADTDALITSTPGLTLALHFADCVCVFLLDPEHKAIGVAHAGWRGTVGEIVRASVEAMTREFGTKTESLQAAISPAIGRHCYEVGEDVAKEFLKAFPGSERLLLPCSPGKWRVDLRMANLVLLKNLGVDDSNIAISDACTCCDMTEFFSYRRDGETGRMGGWMCLR